MVRTVSTRRRSVVRQRYQRVPRNRFTPYQWMARAAPTVLRSVPSAWNRAARQYQSVVRSASQRQRTTGPPSRAITVYRGKRKGYRTAGYMGKRFKRGYKADISRYLKYGYVRHVEKGGTVPTSGTPANDCLYVGHSMANNQLLEAVLGSVVIKLARLAGFSITHLDQKVQNDTVTSLNNFGSLFWAFRNSEGGSPTVASVNLTADLSWAEVVQLFYNAVYTVSLTTIDAYIIDRIWIVGKTAVGNDLEFPKASMQGSAIMLDLFCTSTLAVQNRTQANDTLDADRFNRNDVANNPIAGKSYSGYGTGPVKIWSNNSLSIDTLTGNINSGLIDFDVANANMTPGLLSMMRRPPSKNVLVGTKQCGPAQLAPGQIRNSILNYKKKISLNGFLTRFFLQLREGSATAVRIPMGKWRLFAFEKKCNTGSTEEGMLGGYEINAVYRCIATKKTDSIAVQHTIL